MQLGHRANEIESETISCGASAPLQAGKALYDPAEVRCRHSGTIVDDPQADGDPAHRQAQADCRSLGGVALRILDQVDCRLGDQLAIPQNRYSGVDRPKEGSPAILDRRRVAFRQFECERAHVDRREAAASFAALDFRNAQDRGEERKHLVDLRDRVEDRRSRIVLCSALEPVSQSCQRRPQVMGNIARNLLKIFDQSLDSVQHPVERFGELVELVIARAQRHSTSNVAADDGLRGAADGLKPAPQISAECDGARQPRDGSRQKRESEHDLHRPVDALDPVEIGRDDQALGRGKIDRKSARPVGPLP